MGIAVRSFYHPIPYTGTAFKNSVEDMRTNSTSLGALVRAAYQDLDTSVNGSHDLAGLAVGELGFRNRFRIFYSKSDDEFQIQYNSGTEVSPTWNTYVKIRQSDGRFTVSSSGGLESTGGFYNFNNLGGFYLVARGSTRDKFVFDQGEAGLVFDSTFFYLENVSNSEEVLITLTPSGSSGEVNTSSNLGTGEGIFASKSGVDFQFKSLTATSPISLSSTSTEIDIASSAEANTASSLGGDADVFSAKSGVDLQFRGLTAGNNISLTEGSSAITINALDQTFYLDVGQTDDNPTFSGINTIKFNVDSFYATQQDPSTAIINFRGNVNAEQNTASNLGSGEGVFAQKSGVDFQFKNISAGPGISLSSDSTDITVSSTVPGFYGVIFKESQSGGFIERDDTLVVNSNFFYLSSAGNDGKPLLNLQQEITLEVLGLNQRLDLTETSPPADPDANHIALWAEDEAGFSVIHYKDASGIEYQLAQNMTIVVRNSSGSTISKGQLVYFSGSTGQRPQISLAKADSSSTMPSVGLVVADISNNSFGVIMTQGTIDGIDLSSFSDGDTLFVSADTAGAFTATEPTHPNLHQEIGTVINAANNGTLLVRLRHADGDDSGTISTTYAIGSSSAGSIVLANSSTSQRTATFPDKSGTVAYVDDVGPGFYGLTVGQTDDLAIFRNIDTIKFNTNDFYITQNSPNIDEAIVNFRGVPFSVRESDGLPIFNNINLLSFNADEFYITQGSNTSEAIANFRGLTASEIAYDNANAIDKTSTTVQNAIDNIDSNRREVLTADRDYFVRTDGSDSNDGLVNTAAGAFATIQQAINVVAGIDLDIYTATINLGNAGSYAGCSISAPFIGGPGSSVVINGSVETPSAFVISSQINALNGATITVQGLDFTASNRGVNATRFSRVIIADKVIFGTCGSGHIQATRGGLVEINTDYTIDGSAPIHWATDFDGQIVCANNEITLTGTPDFSSAFLQMNALAAAQINGNTFTGSATGVRFTISLNSAAYTNGATEASYLPGDSAGSTSLGGQHDMV